MDLENKIKCVLMDFEINEITLQEATNRILLLLEVVKQSEQLKADSEPIIKGEQYVADYVSKHGKDLTSL